MRAKCEAQRSIDEVRNARDQDSTQKWKNRICEKEIERKGKGKKL